MKNSETEISRWRSAMLSAVARRGRSGGGAFGSLGAAGAGDAAGAGAGTGAAGGGSARRGSAGSNSPICGRSACFSAFAFAKRLTS